MFIAKVTGRVVATQKMPSMVGQKLLVVEPYRVDAETRSRLVGTGRTFVVVDAVDRVPTRKGVAIPPAMLGELIEALQHAGKKARGEA